MLARLQALLLGGQLLEAARDSDGAAVGRVLAQGADPNALVPGRALSGEIVHTTALCMAGLDEGLLSLCLSVLVYM